MLVIEPLQVRPVNPLLAQGCEDARMVEYGNGVGEVSGRGDSVIDGVGRTDLFNQVGAFVGNTIDNVLALPPEMLILLAIAVLAGLVLVRRAV